MLTVVHPNSFRPQQLLAEKDAELARQYKRMEVEATERSGLRTQFNTAVDEVGTCSRPAA